MAGGQVRLHLRKPRDDLYARKYDLAVTARRLYEPEPTPIDPGSSGNQAFSLLTCLWHLQINDGTYMSHGCPTYVSLQIFDVPFAHLFNDRIQHLLHILLFIMNHLDHSYQEIH